jgi:hypothetical protein
VSISKMCKRGNISERDKRGRCLCEDCKEDRAAYQVKWRQANKESTKEASKKWYIENREKSIENARRWHKENPDKAKEHERRWRIANKECGSKWANNNPEKVKEIARKWRANNKGKGNAQTAKRAAALLQRTPKWADWGKIQAIYIEAARLTKETGISHHVDHVIPLQGKFISGLHIHTNLQILTASENMSKSNRVGGLG